MIRGAVNGNREAVVTLRLRAPGGAVAEIEAVVDTGFNARLTLPQATITALGLPPAFSGQAVIADGSVCRFEYYHAELDWGGWQSMLVIALGNRPLLGMELLEGHELRVAVRPGGAVAVAPLP